MKIKPLKNYYVMVGRNGYPDYGTISCLKRDCINKVIQGSTLTWKEVKKYGWKCVKVNIDFNPVER